MGKKTKVGKARKDKFYFLAKETGYRSRAAFKIAQLNRKYEFLQNAKVLLDLCAAPGGWLQVAHANMPVSSIIVGVDLVPIRPIPNVVTLVEDITTDGCRVHLKKELRGWKVDVVLHDGAPNVGSTWIHDAFTQNRLVLSALKLASNFLITGGWFVTKVFRSRDYTALIGVFGKIFHKVEATKPQASRLESAEIFVVCQGFRGGFDKALLDPKFVFADESEDTVIKAEVAAKVAKSKLKTMLGGTEKRAKADGYETGARTLYKSVPAGEFITNDRPELILSSASTIDLAEVEGEQLHNDCVKHASTTDEVRDACKDVKVLGRREMRILLTWRRVLRKKFHSRLPVKAEDEEKAGKSKRNLAASDAASLPVEVSPSRQALLEERKRRKREVKLSSQLKEKKKLEMVIPGDSMDVNNDEPLFALKSVTPSMVTSFDDTSTDAMLTMSDYSDDDESDGDTAPPSNNPLIVDFESQKNKTSKRVQDWYSKGILADMAVSDPDAAGHADDDDEDDSSAEADDTLPDGALRAADMEEDSSSDSSDSDLDEEMDALRRQRSGTDKAATKVKPVKAASRGPVHMSPSDLALAEEMMTSSKRKREIVEAGFNRHTYADEESEAIPDWFAVDEKQHNGRQRMPRPARERVLKYEERAKPVNARSIKKVVEAKARKKKRSSRKLERARKKAEEVVDAEGLTEAERAQQLRGIYRKALAGKTPKRAGTTLSVAKGGGGRSTSKSKQKTKKNSGKARVKMVDRRLKMDKVAEKRSSMKKSGKKIRKRKKIRK